MNAGVRNRLFSCTQAPPIKSLPEAVYVASGGVRCVIFPHHFLPCTGCVASLC
jgi:hypothetical protein